MLNIETLFLFFFIFSILTILNFTLLFLRAVLQPTPERLNLSRTALIFLAISISYCLTYLIQT